jgi:hypothetical protein
MDKVDQVGLYRLNCLLTELLALLYLTSMAMVILT